MDTTIKAALESEARRDAALFVNEFGTVLDPAKTDWDSEAFANRETTIEDADRDAAWPIYQAALVAETKRLMKG